jgi:hypothetical protein
MKYFGELEMKNYCSIKAGFLIGTITLLILLIVASMVVGYNVQFDKTSITNNYDCYHISEIIDCIHHLKEPNLYDRLEKISKSENITKQADGPPIDSAWPMKCHDTYHTGRSSYGTDNNS